MPLTTLILLFPVLTFHAHSQDTSDIPKSILRNSRNVQIELEEDLGNISMRVPHIYDTFQLWHDRTDCARCGKVKYRFQPRNLPISLESGFVYLGEPTDSIDRLTIRHPEYIFHHPPQTDSQIIFARHKDFQINIKVDPRYPPIIFDTIEFINDRYYSIIILDTFIRKTSQYHRMAIATTTVNNNEVTFTFELLTKARGIRVETFIETALFLFRTIKLSNGI